jgi:hypothetical protein
MEPSYTVISSCPICDGNVIESVQHGIPVQYNLCTCEGGSVYPDTMDDERSWEDERRDNMEERA